MKTKSILFIKKISQKANKLYIYLQIKIHPYFKTH